MNAIVIDPFHRSVIIVELEITIANLSDAINADKLEIAHEFETGDILYVNEDGIARAEDAMQGREEGEHAFAFDVGAHQPFFGKGVIVGPLDDNGQHGSVVMDASRLSGTVFLSPRVATPVSGGHSPH